MVILEASRKLTAVRRFKKLWEKHDPEYATGPTAWERRCRELQKIFPKFSADMDHLYPRMQSVSISLVITDGYPTRYDSHVREQYREGTILLLRYEGELQEALRERSQLLEDIRGIVRLVLETRALNSELGDRYETEAKAAELELSKKSPNVGVVRRAIAFLADIDGTLGLAGKIGQWGILTERLVRLANELT